MRSGFFIFAAIFVMSMVLVFAKNTVGLADSLQLQNLLLRPRFSMTASIIMSHWGNLHQ